MNASREQMKAHTGRDFYDGLYQTGLAAEARWLEYGAIEKANSVEQFLKAFNIQPAVLVELGCGTGAVIRECQRRNFAKRYVAVDYSDSALEFCRRQSRDIEAVQGDIVADLPGISGNVVLLSHTLEHLEHPDACLKHARERMDFEWLVAEVPLENLAAGRLKAALGLRHSRAGHVQFFNTNSFRKLIEDSGYSIVAERNYLPIPAKEALEFVVKKDGLPAPQRMFKRFTQRWLPKALPGLWRRFYIANFAVLAIKRSSLACDNRFLWSRLG
jgi:SAM-dependent methyltransferase